MRHELRKQPPAPALVSTTRTRDATSAGLFSLPLVLPFDLLSTFQSESRLSCCLSLLWFLPRIEFLCLFVPWSLACLSSLAPATALGRRMLVRRDA